MHYCSGEVKKKLCSVPLDLESKLRHTAWTWTYAHSVGYEILLGEEQIP